MANLINYKNHHCKKVTIIDDCMGSGKTSWAIQYMNEAPENKKFIFITPFIAEINRIIQSVTKKTFKEPKNTIGTKLEHLKTLLDAGCNIATTHELFKNFDDEVLFLLRMNNYVLIMDEVIEMIEHVKITSSDMKILTGTNLISVDESKSVKWIDKSYEGRFVSVKYMCETEKLFLHNDTALIWTFPMEVLELFSEVFVLTYMFDCQIQRYYFDWNGVVWVKKSIQQVGERYNGDKVEKFYALTDYIQRSADPYKHLITIYNGKMNKDWLPTKKSLKKGHDNLTFTKLTKMKKDSKIARSLKRNLESFFKKTKNEFNMWTCPKDAESTLKGKGYSGSSKNKCLVSSNARATNEFGHKYKLAYVLNKYMNPTIVDFFKDQGIKIDQDAYALSELVQWIFRSRVRNGEQIELFIPSLRMRTLLQQWLNDEPIQWGQKQ